MEVAKVKDIEEILKYFPYQIYTILKTTLSQDMNLQRDIQEIRIRIDRSILLKTRFADIIVEYQVTSNEILQIQFMLIKIKSVMDLLQLKVDIELELQEQLL